MKRKTIIRIGLTISIIAVMVISVIKINRFFQIDEGLDRGGSENYETNKSQGLYEINADNLTKFYWFADFDSTTNREFLVKGSLLDSIGQFPDDLISILNKRLTTVKIEFVNLNYDTIKIKITNDEFLTERMGSAGAQCFLAETVFTLTENENIRFVKIEMDYGSHAGPGIYNRQSFDELTKK